jgi:hypothetical protein
VTETTVKRREYIQKWRREHKEHILEVQRRWRESPGVRERIRASGRRSHEKYRDERNKRQHARRQHPDYNQMFEQQNGLCAICKKPETSIDSRSGKPKQLALDHDHITGKIRGLLCQKHNIGLGCFDDDPVLMEDAASYVQEHRDLQRFESMLNVT